MIFNYIKIAWRSLLRNRAFSIINITGLTLGIAVIIFIFQYVAFEWSANRFQKNYHQLYRANVIHPQGGGDNYLAPGIAPAIIASFPAVENSVRIAENLGNGIVSVENQPGIYNKDIKAYREEKVSYADGDFFRVFSFRILEGSDNPDQPKSAAISASVAKKYFGSINPVGKVLTITNQFGNTLYLVKTVFEDMPQQSDIKADILLSFKTLEDKGLRDGNDWADPKGLQSGFTNIYFLLKDNANYKNLAEQAGKLLNKLQPQNKGDEFVLQPLSEMHIAPSFNYPLQTFGSLTLVTLFVAVALLILLIAWVNYINLSIAQSLRRAREIGVRKVLGAFRRQLITQFLAETFTITLISVAVALFLVYLFQPYYNNFLGEQLSMAVLNQGWFWPAAIALMLSGAMLSGGYVAVVLTSFSPAKILASKGESVVKGVTMRKALVVFQFTISVIFIISTIVLYRQLGFMKTQDLGMQISQRLVIKGPSVNGGKLNSQSFKNQLAALPFIEKYTASNNIPGKGFNFSADGITRLSPNPGDEKKSFSMLDVDDHYFDAYGIKFSQGDNFTSAAVQNGYENSAKVIINQKAAQQLGFKPDENIVGEKIKWGKTYEIAGVVKDYHHLSLHELIQPMIFLPAVSSGYYTVKLNTVNIKSDIHTLNKLYSAQFPGNPFEYFFLDENYDKQYQSEQKLGNIFIVSASVAILIACMGLFGLASFTTQQRIKEIGIRKVLGASVTNIIQLISIDFLKLVLIAIVIASPIAGYLMNKWLQSFAYKMEMQWWIFASAGLMAIIIALATVGFEAVKAAITNPAESLRSE